MEDTIKKIRKRYGLSQVELAELIGVTQATISLYETGKRNINMETAQKIAIALEVSLDELWHGTGDEDINHNDMSE